MSTIASKQFSLLLMFVILFASLAIDVIGGDLAPNIYATTVQNADYCSSKQLGGPFTYIKDCDTFKVLVRPCCDFPDVITDQQGNKIAECGGFAGYSEECKRRFLPQTQCSTVYCEPQTFPRYGYAPDLSWVSGRLAFNPLEGGCLSLKFSESKDNDIFALNFDNPQQISQFKDGDFVVVKGKQEGKKFSMACPPAVYRVNDIRSNDSTWTPTPQRQSEIKRGNKGQIKIIPPPISSSQELRPEHVADKIVTHGFILIDAYIKELTGFTCSFPNGQFGFTLNTGVRTEISPACAYNKIWRQISFLKPNVQSQITFLDGPEPGTPNQEAVAGVKNTLTNHLIENKMMVKKIFKEDVNLNLRSGNDFQVFIDLMFNSIKLSKPLASGPIPTTAIIPEGILIEVAPADDKDPVKIGEAPISFAQIATNVYFKNLKRVVKIEIDKIKKEALLEIDGKTVNTQKGIEIKNSKLHIKTSVGTKEIKVLPNEAYSKMREITTIHEVKLAEESQEPVYSIKGEKQAKLLFVLPIRLKLEANVNAESGEILSVNKPWWSFLAR